MTLFMLGKGLLKMPVNMLGSSAANIKNADTLINKGTKATTKELNTLGVKAKDDYCRDE